MAARVAPRIIEISEIAPTAASSSDKEPEFSVARFVPAGESATRCSDTTRNFDEGSVALAQEDGVGFVSGG